MKYFDWTATSIMSEQALAAYVKTAHDVTGNPSSTHPVGLAAKQFLEDNRKKIADFLEVDKSNIFFTSGGTESDSIILNSLLNNPVPGEVIVSGIEHSAVLEHKNILEKNGWKFTALKCPAGYVTVENLKNHLNPNVRMVCVMAVNNVTGTIQNIKELVTAVRDFEKTTGRKIHFHCDAVQAVGKIDFRPSELDIDSAAFSAHKFSGPRGTGFLYCRNKAVLALSKGGGQEKGLRPGTENVPAIAAMVTALEDSMSCIDENYHKVLEYRRILESSCKKSGYELISPSCNSKDAFSPYIICISVKPLPSEVFLRIMADKGFCLSAGSACSTNSRGKAESVLTAMNVSPENRSSAIRISLSANNTIEEVEELAAEIENGKI